MLNNGPDLPRQRSRRAGLVPDPCGFCKGGIFGPSVSTILVVVEFKPPPFETRKGWGMRNQIFPQRSLIDLGFRLWQNADVSGLRD